MRGLSCPYQYSKEVNKAKEEAAEQARLAEKAMQKIEAAYFKIEVLQLQSAEEAAYLAKEGQLELARQKFVSAITDTTNLRILSLAYEFFYRTGDLASASDVLEKWLLISGRDQQSSNTAIAYNNLGNIYRTRGDLDCAEEYYRKALELFDDLQSPKAEVVKKLLASLNNKKTQY